MTHKDIVWDKLDELQEASKVKVDDFNELKTLDEKISKLNKKVYELDCDRKKIESKYKQEYTNKLNDKLDDFGILTVIRGLEEHLEGKIISFDGEILKVRYSYQYGQYSQEVDIPIKQLKEQGFYEYKSSYGSVFICDDIKNAKDVIYIIKHFLRRERGSLLNSKVAQEKWIKEYQEQLKEINKQLEEFREISDSKVSRTFNKISFGITDLKIEDILKKLPRVFTIDKEEETNNE